LSRKTPPPSNGADLRLSRIAEEAYRDVAKLKRTDANLPGIDVRFYAYAGLRSTARLRDGTIFLRLSDVFEDAPDVAIGALSRILIAKLLRRRVRKEWNEAYKAHAARDEVVEASEAIRRRRGTKRFAPPAGRVFDLERTFDRLNDEYFGGRLSRPTLGWTLQDAWRTHGHYDPAHETIVLSRNLDDPGTPPFVVDFVMYHEMLHVAMPAERRDGRHMHHTSAFRRAEAHFPGMKEAVAWLEDFCKINGTRRRKGRLKRRG
jgi:hypothetical protein